ncbi:HAD family hydrolase [Fusobacterium sp. PH5-44]|uniref:HAD family hydrolase n=1 Tax=unclassified Fusobacterium TaxID=2648384 RepID=UPI003D23B683
MIKLIATDMDGTLLNEKGNIDVEFWELEKRLKAEGIYFAVASGRQYDTLLSQFEQIKDRTIFIAENGCNVQYQGKEIYSNTIPMNETRKILNEIYEIDKTEIVVCGKKSAYVSGKNKEFSEELAKYYLALKVVDDIRNIDDDVFKIALCSFSGSESHIFPHLTNIKDEYQVVVSGDSWVDISQKYANKGVAIEKIQERFNISYNETMVFGDYLNDLEMMAAAKYSFAMENAHPQLKKVANFQAKSNREMGVINAIKEYCFDKK